MEQCEEAHFSEKLTEQNDKKKLPLCLILKSSGRPVSQGDLSRITSAMTHVAL